MKRALAVLLASLPVAAQEVPDIPESVVAPPLGNAFCYPRRGFCIVPIPDYIEGVQCVQQAPAVIRELESRVKTLRCASLTVTEPSRAPKL